VLRLVLLRISEAYFRHRWLHLLPLVVLVALGAFQALTADPVYLSKGSMYVQRQPLLATLTAAGPEGFSWITPAQATVDELRELFQTDAFVRAVIQNTSLEEEMSKGPKAMAEAFEAVRRDVWVSSGGQKLVTFNAAGETPELATDLAKSTMDNYLQWKIGSEREDSVIAQQFFTEVIQTYQQSVDSAREELRLYLEANPDPVRGDRPSYETLQIAQLQGAVDVAVKRLESAVENEENARLSQYRAESLTNQTYLVIDQPVPPPATDTSLRKMFMGSLIFAIAGVILTFAGIVLAALLDRAFRFPLDVKTATGLPVLAMVPESRPDERKRAKGSAKAIEASA
jgi:uncharacterized protein involved in exopolysaccharide biosynthesis